MTDEILDFKVSPKMSENHDSKYDDETKLPDRCLMVFKFNEEYVSRPMIGYRRSISRGITKILLKDAKSGLFGMRMKQNNGKERFNMTYFNFLCDACVGVNRRFLIPYGEMSLYQNCLNHFCFKLRKYRSMINLFC